MKGNVCGNLRNSIIKWPLRNHQTAVVCINEMCIVIETLLTAFLKFLYRDLKKNPEGQCGKPLLIVLLFRFL